METQTRFFWCTCEFSKFEACGVPCNLGGLFGPFSGIYSDDLCQYDKNRLGPINHALICLARVATHFLQSSPPI